MIYIRQFDLQCETFANDATLFSAVHDVNTSVKDDLMTF